MDTKHTPTPWKAGEHGEEIGAVMFGIGRVATCHGSDREAYANAAFIVRAVNRDHLFDDLLKFAKEMHENCFECEGTGKSWKHADPSTGQWCRCPYGEAIAKAEAR